MALFNEENILFLDEVHRYDCLFNKFNKDFKNKFKKYNCWIIIGEKFGVSPEEAEKKFRNIRTAYGPRVELFGIRLKQHSQFFTESLKS
eukprot:gene16693-8140_t